MTLPWKVHQSAIVLERRWLKIRADRVSTGSGAIIDEFHIVEAPAWVGVICITDDNNLVLVRQYRHGHGGPSLELPAGVMDSGEGVLAAGQRELREETGHTSENWCELWKVRPEPARHAQWAYFTVATNARLTSDQTLDHTEDVTVVLRPVSELDQVVHEMVHGLHVAALLLAERRGLLRNPHL